MRRLIVCLSIVSVVGLGGVVGAQQVVPPAYPLNEQDAATADRFHQIWYDNRGTWQENRWMGITTLQNPMDLWVTQEIIFETKPDFIIECGAYNGGSAVIWATLLEQMHPAGRVISIDIEDRMSEARKLPIAQKRVEFVIASSTAPETVSRVAALVKGKRVLVILDSDHSKTHVLNELRAYAPLIHVGGYLIVQDSNVNGHPALPTFGPGPMEALDEFMAGNSDFAIDRSRERLLFTFSPRGFLKRVR